MTVEEKDFRFNIKPNIFFPQSPPTVGPVAQSV
jgi:hypothetical protein